MSRFPLVFLLLAWATPAFAADLPELHGMIVTSEQQRFLVSAGPGLKGDWVGVGDKVGDWTVADYRAKDQILVLKQADGTEQDLALASSNAKQGAAPGTLQDAQRLFEHMHMQEMLTKILAQQKVMVRQQMARMAAQYKGPATPQEFAQFQQQVLDKLWSGIDTPQLVQNITQIYSETFSSDDLNAMADFYDTPAGQDLINQTPAIQAKMAALIQQQMMPQMQQVAQMQQAFMAAHQAPAPGAAAAAPAKTP